MRILTGAAFATVFAVSTASGQQTQRVNGTIDKVEGNTLYIKSANGPLTLTLADNALIVGVVKATVADIKEGLYIGSGGIPQPDGTQKAVEVRIFHESMPGNGDGHRPGWPGAPNGTMTNGAVGQTVSGVDGPILTVKYKEGEKTIIVGPSVSMQRLSPSNPQIAGGENIEPLLRERLDYVGAYFQMGYASATTPLQNWFLPPTSTSYLRTKSSSPSAPIR